LRTLKYNPGWVWSEGFKGNYAIVCPSCHVIQSTGVHWHTNSVYCGSAAIVKGAHLIALCWINTNRNVCLRTLELRTCERSKHHQNAFRAETHFQCLPYCLLFLVSSERAEVNPSGTLDEYEWLNKTRYYCQGSLIFPLQLWSKRQGIQQAQDSWVYPPHEQDSSNQFTHVRDNENPGRYTVYLSSLNVLKFD
jgi:hypothetical protein